MILMNDVVYLYSETNVSSAFGETINLVFEDRTDADTYFALSEQSRRELSEVFGEGSIKSFVWPYCEQKNKKLVEML